MASYPSTGNGELNLASAHFDFNANPGSPEAGLGGAGASRKRGKGKGRTISRSNSITGSGGALSGGGGGLGRGGRSRHSIGGGAGASTASGAGQPSTPGHVGSGNGSSGADATGEEDDEVGTMDERMTRSGRGAKRRSASLAQSANAAVAKLENQEDDFLDFEALLSGRGGGGGGTTGRDTGAAASTSAAPGPPASTSSISAVGTGSKRGPPSNPSTGGFSDAEDDDEWVAEAQSDNDDDTFGESGRPAKKKARKSIGGVRTRGTAPPVSNPNALQEQLQQGEAGSLPNYASPGTPLTSSAPAGTSGGPPGFNNNNPDPSSTSSSSNTNTNTSKNKPAAPGTGSIVCDFTDPKTGVKCQVRFRRPYDQARHMETVHGAGQGEKAKWTCAACKKQFSRKDALIRHGRISNHEVM